MLPCTGHVLGGLRGGKSHFSKVMEKMLRCHLPALFGTTVAPIPLQHLFKERGGMSCALPELFQSAESEPKDKQQGLKPSGDKGHRWGKPRFQERRWEHDAISASL